MNGMWFALIALAFGSVQVVLQKRALKSMHALEYLVIRGGFLFLFSLLLLPFVDFSMQWQGYALTMLVAVLLSVAIFYENRSQKHMEISVFQPLHNISPLFVLVIAFFALGETVSGGQIAGILLLVAGTYLLELDHEHHGILAPFKKVLSSRYSMFCIGALVIYSITATIGRHMLTTHIDAVSYLVILWTSVSFLLLLFHAWKFRFAGISSTFNKYSFLIFLPALFMMLDIFFYYKALALVPVSLVIAIMRSKSIVTTIAGGRFFHESNLAQKTAACMVMAMGAVLLIF